MQTKRASFLWTIPVVVLMIVVAALSPSEGHPTKYPHVNKKTCKDNPPFLSYHIHMLFWGSNKNNTAGAEAIKEKFVAAFNPGPPCKDLFHEDHLCMFETDLEPVGPFVVAQWAAFIPPEWFPKTVAWIMQNRGDYDVLVHPNSGCENEDHSIWALWGGKPWDIDMSAFSHDEPFPWNETLIARPRIN